MQLDKTRIAIRERSWFDILDLSLHVIRAYPGLFWCLAAGALPAALLNYFVLRGYLALLDFSENLFTQGPLLPYLYMQWLLTMIEIPLATSFITLYLGRALFMEKPRPLELLRQFVGCLGQLIWFQVVIRGLLGFFIIGWVVPYVSWPCLNEVILLERNPFRGRSTREISTYRRSSMLHASNGGDFFVWMLGGAVVATLLTISIWLTLLFLTSMLSGSYEVGATLLTVLLPAAEWIVAGYFAVVRYLSYLDLRIRREGWEVELLLRAERARLVPPIA